MEEVVRWARQAALPPGRPRGTPTRPTSGRSAAHRWGHAEHHEEMRTLVHGHAAEQAVGVVRKNSSSTIAAYHRRDHERSDPVRPDDVVDARPPARVRRRIRGSPVHGGQGEGPGTAATKTAWGWLAAASARGPTRKRPRHQGRVRIRPRSGSIASWRWRGRRLVAPAPRTSSPEHEGRRSKSPKNTITWPSAVAWARAAAARTAAAGGKAVGHSDRRGGGLRAAPAAPHERLRRQIMSRGCGS